MRSIKHYGITSILSTTLLVMSASTVHAQEEFLLEAGKAVGFFAVKQLTSIAYDSACRNGKAVDPGKDKSGDLICGAVSGALGKDVEEFRNEMRAGLEKLGHSIDQLETRLEDLREGQKALHKALDVIALAIDLIPGATSAHTDMVQIRGAWNDHFKPMISGERAFNEERNIAYARYLIFTLGIERNLSTLNETLVRPNSGNKPPLLEQHFNRIMSGIKMSAGTDLEQPYLLFSSVLESLMVEQARGEIIYAWAAAILEAQCSENNDCADAKKLPHRTDEFRTLTRRHRDEQLALFNRLVERMVLDRSSPTSLSSNFLHHDAVKLFSSADLFTAIHTRDGFGVRGRVLSAGQSFNGKMKIAGRVVNPLGTKPRRNKMPTSFDWWSKPAGASIWQTVHFTNDWLVYDVAVTDLTEGSYIIGTTFPWATGPVVVKRIDLATGRVATPDSLPKNIVEFGSFLAIARAGGAYAMMYQAWDMSARQSSSSIGGTSTAPTLSQYVDGKVVYTSKPPSDLSPRINKRAYYESIERLSSVIVADSGKVSLHLRMANSSTMHPDYVPGSLDADVPAESAAIYYTDYQKAVFTDVVAKYFVQTGLEFIKKKGSNGFHWSSTGTPTEGANGVVPHRKKYSKVVKYSAGEVLKAKLISEITFSMPTSGFDATSYKFFTGIAPVAIYFTKK